MEWNFGDLLDATAAVVPSDRPALIRGDRVVSWAVFDARTNRLARAMLATGLPTGTRVAILARNVPEYIEIAAAAFKARLTHVNINYRYGTSEIEYVLADCQAGALFYQSEFAQTVAPLFETLAHLTLGVMIGEGGTYDAMVTDGNGTPLGITRSGDDGYLLYTGGTTGRPKGVMWRAADARATQLEAPTIKFAPASMQDHVAMVSGNATPGRVLPACPLMHGAGLNSSMVELVGGGTVILLPNDKFDPEELWNEVARLAVTRVLIVGDVFARPMVLGARAPTRPVGPFLDAGDLVGRPDVEPRDQAGAGLSDPAGGAGRHPRRVGSVGLRLRDHDRDAGDADGSVEPGPQTVIIDAETNRVLDADETGEGWLARRPPIALGYHGDPTSTAKAYRTIDGIRYAVPGDMAAREPGGRIRLIGRGSQVINTGGEKVFAEEVEEALKRAPGVEDAIIVGVPDPTWGKAVVALARTGPAYDEAAVRAAMRADLAPYKLPKRISSWTSCRVMPAARAITAARSRLRYNDRQQTTPL